MSQQQTTESNASTRNEQKPDPIANSKQPKPGSIHSWVKRRVSPGRFDFDSRGKQAALGLSLMLILTLTLYVTLKASPKFSARCPVISCLSEEPDLDKFVKLNGSGIATITSAEDIDWYVGSVKFVPVKSRLEARNKQIEQARQSVLSDLATLANQLDQLDGRQDRLNSKDTLSDVWRAVSLGWQSHADDTNAMQLVIESLTNACGVIEKANADWQEQKQAQDKLVEQITRTAQDYSSTLLRLQPLVERLSAAGLSDPSAKLVSAASRDAHDMLIKISPMLKSANESLLSGVAAMDKADAGAIVVTQNLNDTLRKAKATAKSFISQASTNVPEKLLKSLQQPLPGFNAGIAQAQQSWSNQLAALREQNDDARKAVKLLASELQKVATASAAWEKLPQAGDLDPKIAENVTNLLATVKAADAQMKALIAKSQKPLPKFMETDICQELGRQLRETLAGLRTACGAVDAPPAAFEMFVARTGGDLQSIARQGVNQTRRSIAIWEGLRAEQEADIATLQPPQKVLFFWTSPIGLVVEVLVWSLLGVLTNLALATSEAVRRKQFKPVERFVFYTKIAYGPVLALVLSLMVVYGMIDLGSYQVRSWAMPLVAFLFGFASRKTANVIDKLANKVLGDASKSAAEGPGAVQERFNKRMQEMELAPTVNSLETTLNIMLPQVIGAIVSQRQKSV